MKDDLLTGIPAIADYLGITVARAYHWNAEGHLPTFKMGAIICARRSELDAHMRGKTRAGQ